MKGAKLKKLLLSSFVCFYTSAFAVTFENVMESVYKHHPIILQQIDKFEQTQNAVRESEGAFDLKLSGEYRDRVQGKHDGDFQNIQLEKSFSELNLNVYTGFRRSQNDFPVYEEELTTLENGEANLGLKLSLLRYRQIDKNRLKLRNSELKNQTQNLQVKLVKEQLRFFVIQNYLDWYYSGKSVEVYEKLLNYTEEQAKALSYRVKKGDLPKIYITENKQYLLKRKTQLEKAKQKFYKSSFNLSLLNRDDKGRPILTTKLPDKTPLEKIYGLSFDLNEQLNFNSSYAYKQLSNELQVASNQQLNAENKLLPKLDLDMKVAKDNGPTYDNADDPEHVIALKFEIPIERNLGKGAVNKYRAKQKALRRKMSYFKEKVSAKFKATVMQLQSTATMIQNYKDEYEVALKMQEAEKIKFTNGGSDYFLLNIREQNSAKAQINLYQARLDYATLYASYLLLRQGIYPNQIL